MKKMFLIFSLAVIASAGLFGGQFIDVDSEMLIRHEVDTGCETGVCSAPVQTSCAEHGLAVAIQDQVLPMVSSPFFTLVVLLSALIALVVVDLKQSFYFQIFRIPLNRRLALNVAKRE